VDSTVSQSFVFQVETTLRANRAGLGVVEGRDPRQGHASHRRPAPRRVSAGRCVDDLARDRLE
jgi:hypothetical protein